MTAVARELGINSALSSLREHAHGRVERRTVKVVTVNDLLFPHARQAIRITRSIRRAGSRHWTRRTAYAVTSLAAEHASATELAAIIRGHWRIEAVSLFHLGLVCLDEGLDGVDQQGRVVRAASDPAQDFPALELGVGSFTGSS